VRKGRGPVREHWAVMDVTTMMQQPRGGSQIKSPRSSNRGPVGSGESDTVARWIEAEYIPTS